MQIGDKADAQRVFLLRGQPHAQRVHDTSSDLFLNRENVGRQGHVAIGPELRARKEITVSLWPPLHPARLRCSSLTYSRYARSSRLDGRAPRRPEMPLLFPYGP